MHISPIFFETVDGVDGAREVVQVNVSGSGRAPLGARKGGDGSNRQDDELYSRSRSVTYSDKQI